MKPSPSQIIRALSALLDTFDEQDEELLILWTAISRISPQIFEYLPEQFAIDAAKEVTVSAAERALVDHVAEKWGHNEFQRSLELLWRAARERRIRGLDSPAEEVAKSFAIAWCTHIPADTLRSSLIELCPLQLRSIKESPDEALIEMLRVWGSQADGRPPAHEDRPSRGSKWDWLASSLKSLGIIVGAESLKKASLPLLRRNGRRSESPAEVPQWRR